MAFLQCLYSQESINKNLTITMSIDTTLQQFPKFQYLGNLGIDSPTISFFSTICGYLRASAHTKYSQVNYFFIQPYLILTYSCSNKLLNTLLSARYSFKIFSLNASKCFGLKKEATNL